MAVVTIYILSIYHIGVQPAYVEAQLVHAELLMRMCMHTAHVQISP